MQEHMARLQLKDPAAPDEHAANSPHGLAPPNRMSSDASALISHFDHWANVLDPEAETPLSRRGSGKLHGLEPDMLRSTVDGLLKRQTVPSQLQSIPGHSRVCCFPPFSIKFVLHAVDSNMCSIALLSIENELVPQLSSLLSAHDRNCHALTISMFVEEVCS